MVVVVEILLRRRRSLYLLLLLLLRGGFSLSSLPHLVIKGKKKKSNGNGKAESRKGERKRGECVIMGDGGGSGFKIYSIVFGQNWIYGRCCLGVFWASIQRQFLGLFFPFCRFDGGRRGVLKFKGLFETFSNVLPNGLNWKHKKFQGKKTR